MPILIPPMYLDPPAVTWVAAHYSGTPTARPLGFTQVPNIVAPPQPAAQPSGFTNVPDAAALQQTLKTTR